MKKYRVYFFFGVLMLTIPALHAQDFLRKAKNYLDAGECEKAQRAYNAYKVENPEGNAEIARQITECKEKIIEKEEDAVYKNCSSIAQCDEYLQRYPNGKYVQEVLQMKKDKEEYAIYEDCNTIVQCDAYLTKYPNGRYLKEVGQKKKALEEKEEDEAYDDCKDFAKCNEYLRNYPNGRYLLKVLSLRRSFGSCGTVKDKDGITYSTIKIGSQCWMAENLRACSYPDGKEIDKGSKYDNNTKTYKYEASFRKGYFYYPNGRPQDSYDYGLLYNWKAASYKSTSTYSNPNRVQGVCPDGWHLPSWSEWEQMMEYVKNEPMYYYGMKPVVRKALASSYYWNKIESDKLQVGNTEYANNTTGFAALPSGQYCESIFPEMFVGNEACFWSSTEDGEGGVLIFKITAYFASPSEPISAHATSKNRGLSVRCVRD